MTNERDKSIDIIKAILICLVVVGHISHSGSVIHRYIYTFHMPVFFIISGYLNNFAQNDFGELTRKVICRYIAPYVSFSLLFIVLTGFHLKDIARLFLGGDFNITSYSYAYWFINVLTISLLLIKYLVTTSGYYLTCTVSIVFWIIAHLFQNTLREVSLPWGLEYILLSVPYMTLGITFKMMDWYRRPPIKYINLLCFGMGILAIVFDYRFGMNYSYNLNCYIIGHGIYDLFIPIIALYALSFIGRIFTRWKVLSKMMIYVGKSSMVIFFTHTYLISKIKRYVFGTTYIELFVLCILSGVVIYYVADKNQMLRKFLLGK